MSRDQENRKKLYHRGHREHGGRTEIEQNLFTAEDAKGAEEDREGKSLPLINADEQGSGKIGDLVIR
jgi:hypothetical protein